MSNPTREQFSELRKRYFDGGDQIMRGVSVGGNPHSGNRIRGMNPPEWAVNNRLLQQVLLRAFPKMDTNSTQRKRAGQWTLIICMFHRRGLSANRVGMELGIPTKR